MGTWEQIPVSVVINFIMLAAFIGGMFMNTKHLGRLIDAAVNSIEKLEDRMTNQEVRCAARHGVELSKHA